MRKKQNGLQWLQKRHDPHKLRHNYLQYELWNVNLFESVLATSGGSRNYIDRSRTSNEAIGLQHEAREAREIFWQRSTISSSIERNKF